MTTKTILEGLGDRARRAARWARAHPVKAVAILPTLALAYVLVLIPFTPSIGDIKKAKMEYPTRLISVDGKEIATYKRANRDWVKLDHMSKNVVDALISTEDKRFFEHHGMDFKRTATALVNTLRGDRQGGSTITQQLARNLYPDDIGRAPTITRKIKEAITAAKIEAVYTKQEILETYLNTVPFLYNAYGVEMASRTYFDKPADKLDVVEAATLVGMLKGTSMYNPVLNPERSIERRNTVMAMMVKNGKLDEAKYESLKKRPLGLDFERLPEVAGPAPHLARYLRQWLGEWAERNGYNLYSDGLVVRTTIDSRVQEAANQAVRSQMEKLQGAADARRNALHGNKAIVQAFIRDTPQYRSLREQGRTEADAIAQLQGDAEFMKQMWADKTMLTAGFMAMEPGTGYVRAWVGSRDFQQDQFDHVYQARRQPGSTFKPFVYGAAFEQGISPAQQFLDGPVEVRIDERTVWRPKDVDAPSMQMMTLRDALAQSKNTVTVQLMQQVGPERVARLAQSMGIRQSKLDVVPSLALGTSPVTLKELVASYGTIANSGSYVEPLIVTRIEDRSGRVLQEFSPSTPQSALATDAANTLLDTLRAAIDNGTGIRIRASYKITGDVAGKTGTTQNDTDGWFVLMHPNLVAGAWVGFNDARVTMLHEWGQGAHSALPIVGDVVVAAMRSKAIDAKAQFAAPRNAGMPDPSLLGRVGDWWSSLWGNSSAPPAQPQPDVAVGSQPLPDLPRLPSGEPAPRVPDASIAGTVPQTPTAPEASGSSGSPSILSLGLPGRNPMPPQAGTTPPAPSGSASLPPPPIAIAPRADSPLRQEAARNEAITRGEATVRSEPAIRTEPSTPMQPSTRADSSIRTEPATRSDTAPPVASSTPRVIVVPKSSSGPTTITLGGGASPSGGNSSQSSAVVRDVSKAPDWKPAPSTSSAPPPASPATGSATSSSSSGSSSSSTSSSSTSSSDAPTTSPATGSATSSQ
ncbi:penicillin-binding protein 1A [Ramlibacter albus]|uniref:penicillin-binding protein 1A n=1 Tax=Ramlibacter albus TaxID=2079448 RepID=UPI001C9AEDB4